MTRCLRFAFGCCRRCTNLHILLVYARSPRLHPLRASSCGLRPSVVSLTHLTPAPTTHSYPLPTHYPEPPGGPPRVPVLRAGSLHPGQGGDPGESAGARAGAVPQGCVHPVVGDDAAAARHARGALLRLRGEQDEPGRVLLRLHSRARRDTTRAAAAVLPPPLLISRVRSCLGRLNECSLRPPTLPVPLPPQYCYTPIFWKHFFSGMYDSLEAVDFKP